MYIVYEEHDGNRKAIAVAQSESEAWFKCGSLNTVFKAAKGIRYSYERWS